MSAPYDYEFINNYTSHYSPSTVHCTNNNLTFYFRRYLLEKTLNVFKWTLPESWNKDYFRYVLYLMGYITIVNTDKFGVIPQLSGLRGYNVFYAPTHAIITNPLISGILEPEIDVDCTVIKLTPDYCGIGDILSYYSDMMALTAEAGGMNIVNSKLAFIVGARNKAMAESMKKMYDMIQAGNPLVVYDSKYSPEDNKTLIEFYSQNLKENFIAPDILLTLKKLENEFASKIGLANVNSEKKERLTNEEVEANRDETYTISDGWLESLKDGCKKANKMFGINISVERRYNRDGNRYNVNSGFVQSEPNLI